MRGDNRLHDREANTAPLTFTLPGRIDAIKTVEQPRQVLRRNRRPRIFHHQLRLPGAFADLNRHRLLTRRVANGVRQQVADCPPQHQRVAVHPACISRKTQRHLFLLRPGFKEVEHFVDLIGQVQGFLLGDQLIIVRLRQKQHVAHHPRHPRKLLQTGVQHIFQLFLAAGLTEGDFRLRHQVGNRRADLMGNIGRKVGLAGEDIFNTFQHMVKRNHQPFQLHRNTPGI